MNNYSINGRTYGCPIQLTSDTMGGKWKMHIIWHLSQADAIRFGELKRRILGGITEKMLIQTLKELELDGLILRKAYPDIPPKVEYSLSPQGEKLLPVMDAMAMFGKNYRAQEPDLVSK